VTLIAETARFYLAFVETGLHLLLEGRWWSVRYDVAHGLQKVSTKYWENQEGIGAESRVGATLCDMLTEESGALGGTQRFG